MKTISTLGLFAVLLSGCDNRPASTPLAVASPTPESTPDAISTPAQVTASWSTPGASSPDDLTESYFRKHPELVAKPTPTPSPTGPTYDQATGKWSDDTGRSTPAPMPGWTKEYDHLLKPQTKEQKAKEKVDDERQAREHPVLFLRKGESRLKEGAQWAISEQALKEEDWDGVAREDLPIRILDESWGVISFHFRGDYQTFYTVREWTNYPEKQR